MSARECQKSMRKCDLTLGHKDVLEERDSTIGRRYLGPQYSAVLRTQISIACSQDESNKGTLNIQPGQTSEATAPGTNYASSTSIQSRLLPHLSKSGQNINTGIVGMRVSPPLLFPCTRIPKDACFLEHIARPFAS